MTALQSRQGPIGFVLRRLAGCLALVGVGVAAAPWSFFYIAAWNYERRVGAPAGTITTDKFAFGVPGGPFLTFQTVAWGCAALGVASIVASACLVVRNRRTERGERALDPRTL